LSCLYISLERKLSFSWSVWLFSIWIVFFYFQDNAVDCWMIVPRIFFSELHWWLMWICTEWFSVGLIVLFHF
jgi:hypothetical protein